MESGSPQLSRQELKRMYRPRVRMPKVERPESLRQKLRRARRWSRNTLFPVLIASAWTTATAPATAYFLLRGPRFHPAYNMTFRRKARLAWRMYRTTRNVITGTSYNAHLAMAAKLLEIPPDVEGVVVECGSFQGGSTANLSLVCKIVRRDLIVYDSFAGLPAPTEGDRFAKPYGEGLFAGSLEVVQENVRRYGAIDVCTFRPGWFSETLPEHREPVVLCFIDVDLESSLHDCVLNLWPKLQPRGYLFLDEFVFPDYCAMFWSERYWKTYFDTTPPGLIGAGSGIPLGNYYLGPFTERQFLHRPTSTAYTRKDLSGYWTFFPEEAGRTSD
jgi:O-methyltransferase